MEIIGSIRVRFYPARCNQQVNNDVLALLHMSVIEEHSSYARTLAGLKQDKFSIRRIFGPYRAVYDPCVWDITQNDLVNCGPLGSGEPKRLSAWSQGSLFLENSIVKYGHAGVSVISFLGECESISVALFRPVTP